MTDAPRHRHDPLVTVLEAPVALRTPGWARVLGAASVPVAIGVVVAGALPRDLVLLGYGLLGLAVLVLVWSARVRVDATADGRLIVRNALTTLTVPREDVGSVEIDDAGPTGRGWAVFVRTHDDLRFRLDVTLTPFRTPLERHAGALRAWRDGRPEPFL